MLPRLSGRILRDWSSLFPHASRPAKIDYLGIAGSLEGGTTTFLGFGDNRSQPLFAVKVHRGTDCEERLRHEVQVLEEMNRHLDALRASIPTVVLVDEMAGTWFTVQTIVAGEPMTATLTSEGVPDLIVAEQQFALAMQFLVSARRVTFSQAPEAREKLGQQVLGTLSTCERTFRLSAAERNFMSDVRARTSQLTRAGGAVQHGDFCRHNLLIKADRPSHLGVIDWTDSVRYGVPLHDLFFFLATYYLQIRSGTGLTGFIEAFEETFLNDGPYSALVRRCIRNYCRLVGIEHDDVPALLALFLAERSVHDWRNLSRCMKRGSFPRFSLYLASLEGTPYSEANESQFWIHFLRRFVARARDWSV